MGKQAHPVEPGQRPEIPYSLTVTTTTSSIATPKMLSVKHENSRVVRSMTWAKFGGIVGRYPLAPVRTMHSLYCHAANP